MKSLSPSSVEIELRSLCLHGEDIDGILYLRGIMNTFATHLLKGINFEAIQAYLHRFLTIYSDMIINIKDCSDDLAKLTAAHEQSCVRFGSMLSKNVCLLKLFSKLPMM